MKSENIRNVALVSHATSGKTTLTEAMLFSAGVINRMGTIADGSTVSDYHEDEIEKQFSIESSILTLNWNDTKINIIDTPGYSDFVGEVVGGLRVVDTALVLIQANHGVETGTETVCHFADEVGLAKVFVINRLDSEHSDFEKCVSMLKESYGEKIEVIQFPVNEGVGFNSYVDLIKMKLLKYKTDGSGNYTEEEIPASMNEKVNAYKKKFVEAIVEHDDALMEKYLMEEPVSEDELKKALHDAVNKSELFPVLCADAFHNIGTKRILDVLENYAPSPLVRGTTEATDENERPVQIKTTDNFVSLLFFKTLWVKSLGELSFFRVFSGTLKAGVDLFNPQRNTTERIGGLYLMSGKNRVEVQELTAGDIGIVAKLKATHTGETLCEKNHVVKIKGIDFPIPQIRDAIAALSKGDEDKIAAALSTLHLEDPSFNYIFDDELKQTIISGQGEIHLSISVNRIKKRFGVNVLVEKPKIPYRETITKKLETIQGKYKKQSGGRGQYGDVHIRISPLPRGTGFEFVNSVTGGSIPGKFIPAVERGCNETLAEGILAGYPAVDVKVDLYYGSYHDVDSSELAFKMAGSMALKEGFMLCNPVILEPIWEVDVNCPEDFMGDVMGDLSSRRGKVLGMETEGHFQIVKAEVPLSELYKYSTTLRSMTQGKGSHRRKFSHYDVVPSENARKIIEERQAERHSEH
ncbi:elongation factor G [bacterium]|nr:elongation factor G [bacterium]